MPYRRRSRRRFSADGLVFALGPIDSRWSRLTEDEQGDLMAALKHQWRNEGPVMLEEWRRTRPGERPWAWWEFDAREDQPSDLDEFARLLELGALGEEEVRAVVVMADEVVADQAAGRVQWPEAPPVVHDGNRARRHLGLPEVETDDFVWLFYGPDWGANRTKEAR